MRRQYPTKSGAVKPPLLEERQDVVVPAFEAHRFATLLRVR